MPTVQNSSPLDILPAAFADRLESLADQLRERATAPDIEQALITEAQRLRNLTDPNLLAWGAAVFVREVNRLAQVIDRLAAAGPPKPPGGAI